MMMLQKVVFFQLKNWWNRLCSFGHPFGYNVNAPKAGWLLRKDLCSQLGMFVWDWCSDYFSKSSLFRCSFRFHLMTLLNNVSVNGLLRLLCLSSFANTQPHASYSAFTHGYVSKRNYYFHTNYAFST